MQQNGNGMTARVLEMALVMQAIKQALDPRGLMNPGKVLRPPQQAADRGLERNGA